VSRVGEDERGEETLRLLASRKVDVRFVQRDLARPTGRVRVSLEEGRPTYEIVTGVAWDAVEWEPGLRSLSKRGTVLCYGTLAQRGPESRRTLLRMLRLSGPSCIRLLDINFRQHYHTEGVVIASLGFADILKLSDEETPILRAYLGGPEDDGAFLAGVLERFGIETAVLTLGPGGCRVIGPEGDLRIPAAPQRVVNTVGAGDAFTAAFILSRLAGRNAAACARHANRVGGYVTTQDSGTPDLPEEFRIT
jgi:fructokinase